MTDQEREVEARRLAESGLGSEDLVVRLGLTLEHAKRIVWSVLMKRKGAA